MGRIKPGKKAQIETKIKATKIEPDQRMIRFSFKYTDFSKDKFKFDHCGGGYLTKLISRFKDLSSWCVGDFCANRSDALRAHPIKWNKTTEKNGFSLPEHLKDSTPFQFQISRNEHGRVHGFIIGNTFFIVWLDPDHKLYK